MIAELPRDTLSRIPILRYIEFDLVVIMIPRKKAPSYGEKFPTDL